MFKIRNHKVVREDAFVDSFDTPNRKGFFKNNCPEGIVLHDTAGRLDHMTSVRWFQNSNAKVSAHLVVGRKGEVVQLARLNAKAWHAGHSLYKGYVGLNNYAVGIEIANPGCLENLGEGRFKAWFGEIYSSSHHSIRYKDTLYHKPGWWMDYTQEQIDTLTHLCSAIYHKYNMSFITTHWYISPGRKEDTNPFFHWKSCVRKCLGMP